jgi:hypothetical protein
MSPFREFNIDDLLAAVRSSSENVRVCSEEVMDGYMVDMHHTVHSHRKLSDGTHVIVKKTDEEVGQLLGKIEELMEQQKSFNIRLEAVSSKNSLLNFLTEYLSKLKSALIYGSFILTYQRATGATW